MPMQKTGHIDRYLSNMSVKIANAPDAFGAEGLFPVATVTTGSDKIAVYGKDHLRIAEDLRADGAPAATVESTTATADSFKTEEYALKDFYTDRQEANTDRPFDLRADIASDLMSRLMLSRENRCATLACTAASYGSSNKSTKSGTSQWDQYDTSTPIEDIITAICAVQASCGKAPNTIMLPWKVAQKISIHPDILALASDNSDMRSDVRLPRILLGLATVVPQAFASSAAKGQSTQTWEAIWSDYVVVAYVDPNPRTERIITFGAQLRRVEINTRRWFDENTKANWIETSYEQDEKLLSADCGYLFSDTLS